MTAESQSLGHAVADGVFDGRLPQQELVAGLRAEVLAALSERTRAHQAAGRAPLGSADEQALGRQLIADALEARARDALGAREAVMSEDDEDRLARAVFDALFRLNRLQSLLDDPGIENINANGCDVVWVRYADGRREQAEPIADSDAELEEMLRTAGARVGIGERRFDRGSPRISLQLPDGSRLFALMAVAARPCVSIRRHRYLRVTLDDLIPTGTVDVALREFLRALMAAKKSCVICGGTGAGKTTLLRAMAAGIGVGYPLAGLFAQYLGLYSAFWFGAAVAAAALLGAAVVLPASPSRQSRLDLPGAVLLGAGIAGVLLVVAEGSSWGWGSALTVVLAVVSVVVVAGWVLVELGASYPLIDLRLLRHRSVLAANATGFLVSLGFYPLMSLVVRFVQTPPSTGYGFGAPVVIAGLMLTPFSAASFTASRVAKRVVKRTSSEWVVAGSGVILIGAFVLFLFARGAYWEIIITMAAEGFGVGCVFAVNPLQIVAGVPDQETGSAMSFYQVVRTVAYSIASAISATALVLYIPAGHSRPTNAGYSAAAVISIIVLIVGLVISAGFASTTRRAEAKGPEAVPGPDSRQAAPSDERAGSETTTDEAIGDDRSRVS